MKDPNEQRNQEREDITTGTPSLLPPRAAGILPWVVPGLSLYENCGRSVLD